MSLDINQIYMFVNIYTIRVTIHNVIFSLILCAISMDTTSSIRFAYSIHGIASIGREMIRNLLAPLLHLRRLYPLYQLNIHLADNISC